MKKLMLSMRNLSSIGFDLGGVSVLSFWFAFEIMVGEMNLPKS